MEARNQELLGSEYQSVSLRYGQGSRVIAIFLLLRVWVWKVIKRSFTFVRLLLTVWLDTIRTLLWCSFFLRVAEKFEQIVCCFICKGLFVHCCSTEEGELLCRLQKRGPLFSCLLAKFHCSRWTRKDEAQGFFSARAWAANSSILPPLIMKLSRFHLRCKIFTIVLQLQCTICVARFGFAKWWRKVPQVGGSFHTALVF